jgi:hypothetical protein
VELVDVELLLVDEPPAMTMSNVVVVTGESPLVIWTMMPE